MCRAFLWQGKELLDLNTLSPDSPLYLRQALSINDAGQIAGIGVVTNTGETHAFLATPVEDENSSESLVGSRELSSPDIQNEVMRNVLRLWLGPRGR